MPFWPTSGAAWLILLAQVVCFFVLVWQVIYLFRAQREARKIQSVLRGLLAAAVEAQAQVQAVAKECDRLTMLATAQRELAEQLRRVH